MYNVKLKYGQNCVYKDNLSIVVNDVLGKFIWFGHVFFLPLMQKQLYIPATNTGWKWILDYKNIGLTSSGIKLLGKDNAKSYMSVFYESQDPVPYPMTLGLNLPEFVGNFVSIVYEDAGCRTKSVLHPVTDNLHIDDLKVVIHELNHKHVMMDIFENE
jgi:hypothetical protein